LERRVDGELAGTKNVAVAVAALAVPIIVLVVGSYYTNATKEREVSGKFVELAEAILSKEPTKTDTDTRIRTWATLILDRYSGFQFDIKTRDDTVNHTALR
jgi:ABC-type anion transport system duplicated permease subunit